MGRDEWGDEGDGESGMMKVAVSESERIRKLRQKAYTPDIVSCGEGATATRRWEKKGGPSPTRLFQREGGSRVPRVVVGGR